MTTVISTFSGCGGSSLGYRLAGSDLRLAVEWNAHAVATYRRNFTTPVWQGDIRSLTSEACLELAGMHAGEVDVLDGSPPCQGFSMAGRRDVGDERNSLFREYVRLLRDIRPRACVLENVPGLVTGKMRPIFRRMVAAIRACGYRVAARVLNAADYGVPQCRRRLILVGFRDDLDIVPTHPQGSPNWVTVGGALQGCPADDDVPQLDRRYGNLWWRLLPGQNAADLVGRGWGSMQKLDPRRPSITIPSLNNGTGYATLVHWRVPRAISVAETKRLMSFPDDFAVDSACATVCGRYKERMARLGNSVPPMLMKAIASHVRRQLESVA